MESLTLDMDDIFDDHDEAEGAYPTRLPDLQEDPLSETNAAENDADNGKTDPCKICCQFLLLLFNDYEENDKKIYP